jgi:hypothetical protein
MQPVAGRLFPNTTSTGLHTMNRIPLIALSATLGLAAVARADVPFTLGATLPTPTRPSGSAVGDFNGDGRADIAVASDTPDRISIFLRGADGSFTLGPVILTGSGTGPESLIAADIDGDGRTDLVVALHNANIVRAYRNTATGFVAGSSVPTGANPHTIHAADLNGDGVLDFIAANRDGNSLTVIRSTAGVLSAAATITTNVSEPRGMAVGDFNGDGNVDIAVANHRSRNVALFMGQGGMSFTPGAVLPAPINERPEEIAAGDIYGDGDIDLVATAGEATVNVVGVYRNSAGVFASPVSVNTGGVSPSRVEIVDLTADGRGEIIVANEDSGTVAVIQNISTDGSLQLAAPTVIATGAHPEEFTVADVNGDNKPDIVVPNRDADTTVVLINGLSGSGGGIGGGGTTPPCAVDWDHDGSVTVRDIFEYLNGWFAGDERCDFDHNGHRGADDVIEYIGAWMNGC